MSSRTNSNKVTLTVCVASAFCFLLFIASFLWLKNRCEVLTGQLKIQTEEFEQLRNECIQVKEREKQIKGVGYRLNTDIGSLYPAIPLPKDEKSRLYLEVNTVRSSRTDVPDQFTYLNKVVDTVTGVEYVIQSLIPLPLDKIIEVTSISGFPKLRFLTKEEFASIQQSKKN